MAGAAAARDFAGEAKVAIPDWLWKERSVKSKEPAQSTIAAFTKVRRGHDTERAVQLTLQLAMTWPKALERVLQCERAAAKVMRAEAAKEARKQREQAKRAKKETAAKSKKQAASRKPATKATLKRRPATSTAAGLGARTKMMHQVLEVMHGCPSTCSESQEDLE